MRAFLTYYLLTLAFYLVEIAVFASLYASWNYDVFWLNIAIRLFLILIFSIIVRNLIFTGTKYFYIKFSVLVLLNPLMSSSLLKILTIFFLPTGIIVLKILTDLITSLLMFFVLRKIS